MFSPVDVKQQLSQYRMKNRTAQDQLLVQAQRILQRDLFTDKKILDHLKNNSRSFGHLDEEDISPEDIFSEEEIKQIAIRHRLKFLDVQLFKPGIPYDVVLRIKELNTKHHKDLTEFLILAPPRCFSEQAANAQSALFVKTNNNNFYLIHRWGLPVHWTRQFKYWPLRRFENLLLTIITFTLLLTLSLPTWLITLDPKAEYWSGYRAAAFFHLFIFNTGFTTYITFAFSQNFSSSVWNRKRDFG